MVFSVPNEIVCPNLSELRIGTAGWSLPSRYADQFPGPGTHLQRYAGCFDAAEINSTFHRPHRSSTFERWAEAVGSDFRFSVKLPKEITHVRRLRACDELVVEFLSGIAPLRGRLGPLLVQLPPSSAFESDVAKAFFGMLRDRFGGDLACEPRHGSWFCDEVDAVLTANRVARVAADPALSDRAATPGGWDRLIYYRLHGSPRPYYSDYSTEYLISLARTLERSTADGAAVWCIFDNTASGAAAGNALALRREISRT